MTRDRHGLPLTTDSPRATEAYVDAVDRMLAAATGGDARLGAAIAADDGLALAHAALARSLQVQGRGAEAREAAAVARARVAGASARERGHVEAIATAVEGDAAGALRLVYEHLEEYPRDALVLSLTTGVYGLIGFGGERDREAQLRGLLDGLAADYGDDWWFLSAHGFACTEAGDPRAGRRLIERSLRLRTSNAHAAHAYAHALQELGDDAGAAAFLETWLPGYDRAGAMHVHVSWHLALCCLALGQTDRAWTLYETSISPAASRSTPLSTLVDGAAFLWRYGLRDPDRPLPWGDLRDFAGRAFPRAGVAFADVHCALAFAGAGDAAALDRRLAELREAERQERLPAGPVVRVLGEAARAFARAEAAEAARLLESVRDEIVRIGGSRLQRRLFDETLAAALDRARPGRG